MKKLIAVTLVLLFALALITGCEKKPTPEENFPQNVQIANPWSNWTSIEEAEAATGLSFGLPNTIADAYAAEVVRTMNGELFEVVYRNGEYEVCVRKQAGEGQDISGDYTNYQNSSEKEYNGAKVVDFYNSDNAAMKQTVSYDGYSWSIVAPNGFAQESGEAFINAILQ